MLVEVFKLFQTRLVVSPLIARRFDNLIVREAALSDPTREVIDTLNY